MRLNDYVPLAVRTESRIDNVVFDFRQMSQLFEIVKHSTELMDLVKKNVFYGKPINQEKWYRNLHEIVSQANNLGFEQPNNNPVPIRTLDPRLFHSAIGIFTEAGEMFAALSHHAVDKVNFREELGDVEWYQAIAYDALGFSAEQNLQNNIDKLTARYPNKFDQVAAIERNLEAERAILEMPRAPLESPACPHEDLCQWKLEGVKDDNLDSESEKIG